MDLFFLLTFNARRIVKYRKVIGQRIGIIVWSYPYVSVHKVFGAQYRSCIRTNARTQYGDVDHEFQGQQANVVCEHRIDVPLGVSLVL